LPVSISNCEKSKPITIKITAAEIGYITSKLVINNLRNPEKDEFYKVPAANLITQQ
jgi:hypothetical protein